MNCVVVLVVLFVQVSLSFNVVAPDPTVSLNSTICARAVSFEDAQAMDSTERAKVMLTKFRSQPLICVRIVTKEGTRVIPFYPFVDRFSVLTLRGTGQDPYILARPANAQIQIEANGVLTNLRTWGTTAGTSPASGTVFGEDKGGQVSFWTIRVGVVKGIITSLRWDDIGCPASSCRQSLCVEDLEPNPDAAENPEAEATIKQMNCAREPPEGETFNQCVVDNSTNSASTSVTSVNTTEVSVNTTSCDMKIYLVWRGTDRRGQLLETDNLRLSQMMRYSISRTFTRASELTYDATGSMAPTWGTLIATVISVVALTLLSI